MKESVASKMEITADDGKKYKAEVYNLDAMIAVGYRANSKKQLNLEYGQLKF